MSRREIYGREVGNREQPFAHLYDTLRGLHVIRDLSHSRECRAWFVHGFILETPDGDACPHSDRKRSCLVCGCADAFSPAELWAFRVNLERRVRDRDCIAGVNSRVGTDGLPMILEYEPPLTGNYDPETCDEIVDVSAAEARRNLQKAEAECWKVWDHFKQTVHMHPTSHLSARTPINNRGI